MKQLPPVDPALIEWLEDRFPNQVPDIDDSDRRVWMKAGHQEVITELKRVVEKIARANLKVN